MSEYFASKEDVVKALKYSKEALSLVRSSNSSRDILLALKNMAVIVSRKVAIYRKEYINSNEQLQKAERSMEISLLVLRTKQTKLRLKSLV